MSKLPWQLLHVHAIFFSVLLMWWGFCNGECKTLEIHLIWELFSSVHSRVCDKPGKNSSYAAAPAVFQLGCEGSGLLLRCCGNILMSDFASKKGKMGWLFNVKRENRVHCSSGLLLERSLHLRDWCRRCLSVTGILLRLWMSLAQVYCCLSLPRDNQNEI